MKLFLLLSFFITVAYTAVIQEEKNVLNNGIEDFIPTATSKEPAKIFERALTTQYIDLETITIFKEGWDNWNSNWDTSISRDIKNGPKVVDGVMQVDIKVNGGLLMEDINLESRYGIVTFDYKIETPENKEVELHLYTFMEIILLNKVSIYTLIMENMLQLHNQLWISIKTRLFQKSRDWFGVTIIIKEHTHCILKISYIEI